MRVGFIFKVSQAVPGQAAIGAAEESDIRHEGVKLLGIVRHADQTRHRPAGQPIV